MQQIEKEAQQIIEAAQEGSERIEAEAANKARVILSDIRIDTSQIRDGIVGDAKSRRDETLSSTREYLEKLEEKFRRNSDEVVQQIVRAVAGAH